jgi:Protein of unknown function (DUF2563)
MFVDTDLLRMGAQFSRSAGTIVERGATEFASTTFSAGIFGDFEAAHGFHSALSAARQVHADTMAGHHAELEGLAAKADSAATTFRKQDETLADGVSEAATALPDH